jgi:hypothetical protein
MPLFWWLVDATVINCHLIALEIEATTRADPQKLQNHHRGHPLYPRDFWTDLAWNLVIKGTAEISGIERFKTVYNPAMDEAPIKRKRPSTYCTASCSLPSLRHTKGDHIQVLLPKGSAKRTRLHCFYCRWLNKKGRQIQLRKASFCCTICSSVIPLCQPCFKPFHYDGKALFSFNSGLYMANLS